MNTCLACRQHIETLKIHAQLLIHNHHQLLKENDVLASTLKQLSTPSEEQKLWKEKYEGMMQLNMRLEQSCRKVRIVRVQKQNSASKRNHYSRERYSGSGSIKRSGSVSKMQNFMNRVLQKPLNGFGKLREENDKKNKRARLRL